MIELLFNPEGQLKRVNSGLVTKKEMKEQFKQLKNIMEIIKNDDR